MYQDPRHGQRPPGPPPYGPPHPMYQHGHIVSKTGLSGLAHAVHAVITFFTCGFWSPVWITHALLAKRKTVTRY